ncbi:hypothetical protein PG991_009145 [Apiospora marii]|uniref:Uncharacterized protein n=1 Tax=Apiospora marii TaxID=335849 RepID=A0ABR1RKW2_9PEZI
MKGDLSNLKLHQRPTSREAGVRYPCSPRLLEQEGEVLIAKFLKQKDLHDDSVPNEERNLAALRQILLNNMINLNIV